MKKKILIIVFFIALSGIRFAQAAPSTSAFSLLKINHAAYSSALGNIDGAFTPYALLHHPASIAWIDQPEIQTSLVPYYANTSLMLLSYIKPLSFLNTLAVSIGQFNAGGLTHTIVDPTIPAGYREIGSFEYTNTILAMSYASVLSSDLSWGTGITAVRETIDTEQTMSFVCSGSLSYTSTARAQFSAGFYNLGPAVNGDQAPLCIFIHGAQQVIRPLIVDGELALYRDNTSFLRSGAAYMVIPSVFLRAGIQYPLHYQVSFEEIFQSYISFGFGIKAGSIYTLDYAWMPSEELEATHRISLSIRLGKSRSEAINTSTETLPGMH